MSEQGVMGFAIGVSTLEKIAIAEFQTAEYIFHAVDQIVNEAAKYRYRSGDQFNCGMVTVRVPYGAHEGSYNGISPEAYFAQTPGLVVVFPRGPRTGKGLLRSAIRQQDPTIFFEPERLYHSPIEDVPDEDYTIPLFTAEVVQEGNDITVVAWGAQVGVAQEAAKLAKQELDVDVEIVDLQTVMPWDEETVMESVWKTGRLVVTHEAPQTSGFGAEVVAAAQQECFEMLRAPCERVCRYDTPTVSNLRSVGHPDKFRVFEAIKRSIHY